MPERERKQKPAPKEREEEVVEDAPATNERGEKLKEDIDDLLDEIDSVLRGQRGGVCSELRAERVDNDRFVEANCLTRT